MLSTQGHFFCNSATEEATDLRANTLPTHAVTIFFREEHRDAQRSATRNDGHFVDWIVIGHQPTHNRVPGLMVSGVSLFFL